MKRRDVIASLLCASTMPPAHPQQKLDKATVDRWMKELSNWGRWGKADQLGTVNLFTPAKRKQAIALAREGHCLPDAESVGVPLDRCADSRDGRHRIGAESHRDVLI
jgi:hypothetical protein